MRIFCDHFMLVAAVLSICSAAVNAQQNKLHIGSFSQGDLDGWQVKKFIGDTEYKMVSNSIHADKVLMASSNNSASGLFKEQRIDLQKTPYLHWSWKTQQLYVDLQEQTKKGDDYVARLYVVINGGLFFWQKRALCYVWSSSSNTELSWSNPYTSKITMFAVEVGSQNLDQWNAYQRNVREDVKLMIGKEVRYIDAVAIMTDSDDAGQQAITYYGDIYFSAQP